jgi:hypothetical protein
VTPHWADIRIDGFKGGAALVSVRLRWWAPSFWRYIAAQIEVKPTVAKPFVVAWLVLLFAWRGVKGGTGT